MSVLDDMRVAGFSEQQIQGFVNDHRDDMRGAGFSDQEIDKATTGRTPPYLPMPFISRFIPRTITEAAQEGWEGGFGDKPVIKLTEEQEKYVGMKPGLQINKLPAVIRASDYFLRGMSGALSAAGAMTGQAVSEELGQDPGMQARARRDYAQAFNIVAMLMGAQPVSQVAQFPRVEPPRVIGPAPNAQDFTNAARAIQETGVKPGLRNMEEIRRVLIKAYEEQGVHPAEAAEDTSLLRPQEKAPEPPPPEPHPLPMPLSEMAKTGDVYIDAILDNPITKNVIDNGFVRNDVDVPYGAAGTIPLEWPETLIDRHFPEWMESDGIRFQPRWGLITHENVEQHLMDELTKAGMDDDTAWKVSHFFATQAEHAVYKRLGLDPAKVEAAYKPILDQIQHFDLSGHEPGAAPPGEMPPEAIAPRIASNMYLKPYAHLDVAAAAKEPTPPDVKPGISEPPSDGEIARARAILEQIRNAVTPEGIPQSQAPLSPPSSEFREGQPTQAPLGTSAEAPPWQQKPAPPPPAAFDPRPSEPGQPYFKYDDSNAWLKAARQALDLFYRTFIPEQISDRVLTAEPAFRQYNQRTAAEKTAIIKANEDDYQAVRNLTEAERMEIIRNWERSREEQLAREGIVPGVSQRMAEGAPGFLPQVVPIVQRLKRQLNSSYAREVLAGSQAEYISEYLPHIYEDPVRAKNFFQSRIAQLGPRWFQKERVFETIHDAMQQGLRLKSTNVVDLVTHRLIAGADMIERMNLLKQLQEEHGLATPAEGAPPALQANGWEPINAPDGKQWLIAPDASAIWHNAVAAKGLWGNQGMPGTLFRGWMAFKGAWVPLKLMGSMFHPAHVVLINAASYMGSAYRLLGAGDLLGALQTAAAGVYTSAQAAPGFATGMAMGTAIGTHLAGPLMGGITGSLAGGISGSAVWALAKKLGVPDVPFYGRDIRQIINTSRTKVRDLTPEQQVIWDRAHRAGFFPEQPEEQRLNAQRLLEDAMDNSRWVRMLPRLVRRAIEVAQAPVFHEWIPNIKAAAFMRDVQALERQHPWLLDDPAQHDVALGQIAKSMDNRFGEMFYRNLFWDRYVADLGKGAFLSLGWNLGGAREFGGALLQGPYRVARRLAVGETETQATIAAAQNKVAFAVAYVGGAMLLNGLLTYFLSGKPPAELNDSIFPWTGGMNPDGTKHRLSTMHYTREIPMLKKHIEEEGWFGGSADFIKNKLMIGPFVDIAKNRDYYGGEVRDENSWIHQQAYQTLKYLFKDQMAPISMSGAMRSQELGGEPWEVPLALWGFGPAPSYAERSRIQNVIQGQFNKFAPAVKPYEEAEQGKQRGDLRLQIMRAQNAGDQDQLRELSQEFLSKGGSRQGLSNILNRLPFDIAMFRRLPDSSQAYVMSQASEQERSRYGPYMKTHIASKVADVMVDRQKAEHAGDQALADSLSDRMQLMIRKGVQDGHIHDMNAFNRSVMQELLIRQQPALGAVMSLPRWQRGQQPQ